jgi:hypothetical protein
MTRLRDLRCLPLKLAHWVSRKVPKLDGITERVVQGRAFAAHRGGSCRGPIELHRQAVEQAPNLWC